jgi:predicted peptidase
VSPQCPDGYSWSPLQLALLIDELEKKYEVDKDRIYVTGLSMGGMGTWSLLHQFPERFAAGVPICGGIDPFAADRLVNIPLWVFHGAKDTAVPLARSTDVVDAIKTLGGKLVHLTIYPDLEHDSWTITYDNPEVYRWLLEQRRK